MLKVLHNVYNRKFLKPPIIYLFSSCWVCQYIPEYITNESLKPYLITTKHWIKTFAKPLQCTLTHRVLSKGTKTLAKGTMVLGDLNLTSEQNKQPSLIDRLVIGPLKFLLWWVPLIGLSQKVVKLWALSK
jgi:hypothetical protein